MDSDLDADAQWWNQSYRDGRPPWDKDGPPLALVELIGQLPPDPLRVLIPCAGLGHDALAWAQAGHDAIAVDFAALAVAGARRRAEQQGVNLKILEADIFELGGQFQRDFDLVWEQTCLCAIDPDRRGSYFEVMAAVLKEGGDWYGLLWNHGRQGGPPYDLTIKIVEDLFPPAFEMQDWRWVQDSGSARHQEFLVHLRKISEP